MRVQLMVNAWRSQIPALVDAYLLMKRDGPMNSDSMPDAWEIQVIGFEVRHGYIGASPDKVSIAFPILHRVCPRYSLDALSKTLMNVHHAAHRTTLAEQLSTAYDAYLEMMRQVDSRVHAALGRDATWYSKNVCPPCMYKTVNEPPLKFSLLAAMDGNNSLKLVDSAFRAGSVRPDDRTLTSFRWLTPDQVNVYQDEVVNSQKSQDDGDVAWLNINELNSNETEELAKCISTCVERWKAAGPEARKKMFALFAIAGIFLSVCRHGHVLVMCDMIRSGELMKYPLALVKRLLDTYGADICLGYDIMCAFFKTLYRSSLRSDVVALRLQGVVPAFHGHAHNRTCQLGWHPLYVEGVGCEDFEECERTFSKSNNLASITRGQTPFHRQQTIDEHFQFNDHDKHAASGNFIFQNHRQALEKIVSNRAQLVVLESHLGTTGEDYEAYYAAEVKQDADRAKEDYLRRDYFIIHKGYSGKQLTALDTRYRTTWTKFVTIQETLCRFKEQHLITERWTTSSDEYKATVVLLSERKYRSALSELERLAVARLFELTKLNISGVGYKLREKISKALKTRAEAIRRALAAYNEAATGLTPPREPLQWADVIAHTSLAEFDLLRETWTDVRTQPWAQPVRREAMVLYFGIKRAKEELVRLNVEIRRLITYMFDEHVDLYRAIASNLIVNPPLAMELSQRWLHAGRISAAICRRLVETSNLNGFTGSLFPGAREGRDAELSSSYEEPELGEVADDNEDLVVRELDIDEDGLAGLIDHLTTFDDT
ncbi:hypothetical protein C8J57DRAFT_1435830 [Mycena rebaudengoi]|nr:hypothetical protein C8J57DRAFT_1435830 [Mycena rebaudengoi]